MNSVADLSSNSNRNSPVDRSRPKTHDGTNNLFVCFRLLGYIEPEKFRALFVTYTSFIRIILVLVPLSFGMSFFRSSEKWQINNLLSSIQIYINTVSCVVRVIIFYSNRKYIFKIETILDKLDARMNHPEEIKEAWRVIKFGNRALIFFLVNYSAYSIVTLLGAVLRGRPPYGLYIPYLNWRDSTWNLAAASAIESITVNISIFHQLGNDVFPVIYVGICNSHLKILVMRVLRIGADSTATQKHNRTELVQCILDHKTILELISTIDPVLSATFFVQFVASTVAMCVSLANITISDNNDTLFGALVFIFCLLIETFWACYFVTSLTDTGNRLPEAIFQMNWIDQDMEFKRLLLFFMQRSQQDITLFAGKLFPISLNTFVSMNKFSFSLYTLLDNIDISKWFK